MCGIGFTMKFILVIGTLLMTRTSQALVREDPESVNSQCDAAIKEVEQEDRATVEDDNPSRLYYTWLSQECEMRAGPEYIIRKYMFYKSGTFLLLRYHYADESCSVATHTVSIHGYIKLLKPSTVVSGATKTSFRVDAVNIMPLNLQVARKLGYKLNQTCGPQPMWRPYFSELVYENPRQHSTTWQNPFYNSPRAHSPGRSHLGVQCLQPFGIEFSELRLLRVQKKLVGSPSDTSNYTRYQLFLASPPPNVRSRWNHKPTSLQPVAMIRTDTANGCPVCGSVIRSTAFNPPLLHEVVALPALIGGYWHSERCESSRGGVWSKRQFQIYSKIELWTGRWDYYDDPRCTTFLYAITAAGSYVQHQLHVGASRQQRDVKIDKETFDDYHRDAKTSVRISFKKNVTHNSDTEMHGNNFYHDILYNAIRPKRIAAKHKKTRRRKRALEHSLNTKADQLLHNTQSPMIQSRIAAMLRGHQTYETTTKKPSSNWDAPTVLQSSTIQLDLHIADSALIPGITMSTICGNDRPGILLINWSRTCIPHAIKAPSALEFQAKLGVNWNGQYILLLGSRNDMWDAPLRQCKQVLSKDKVLQEHLRRKVRFRVVSPAMVNKTCVLMLIFPLFTCYLYSLLL